MAKPLTDLAGWTTERHWPRVACPICAVGSVGYAHAQYFLDRESELAADRTRRGQAPPDELSGSFNGALQCDNADCAARLSMVGAYAYSYDYDEDAEQVHLFDMFKLEYVTPPFRLFIPPARTPKEVTAEIDAAGAILFASPSAAGNRLRRSVEELLDAQGVRKTQTTTKKDGTTKRSRLTLHARIELFGASQPDVEKVLLAVKWIGNDASHGDELAVADVVLCGTVLEAALKSLYDRSDSELLTLVTRINARKGLGRR
ncbi:DUF4145 domain-containing protein [Curtobacterium luteum]|uniref:DUF4145 domain-containing protein n=1 Tax=Curtobacterium luteum TaxID=33881 RepID=UPI0037F8BE4B